MATFCAVLMLAAFSISAEILIATCALLCIESALLAPSTFLLIRNMFIDSFKRKEAISAWVISVSVAVAAGRLVGSMMLEYFW